MGVPIKVDVSTQVKTKKTAKIDRDTLRALLKSAGLSVPEDAEIYITVPGGGDWSNMDLELDEHIPVVVEWTEIEES